MVSFLQKIFNFHAILVCELSNFWKFLTSQFWRIVKQNEKWLLRWLPSGGGAPAKQHTKMAAIEKNLRIPPLFPCRWASEAPPGWWPSILADRAIPLPDRWALVLLDLGPSPETIASTFFGWARLTARPTNTTCGRYTAAQFFTPNTRAENLGFRVRKAVLGDRNLYFAPPISFRSWFLARTQSQFVKNNFETLHAKRGLRKAIMAASEHSSLYPECYATVHCRVIIFPSPRPPRTFNFPTN